MTPKHLTYVPIMLITIPHISFTGAPLTWRYRSPWAGRTCAYVNMLYLLFLYAMNTICDNPLLNLLKITISYKIHPLIFPYSYPFASNTTIPSWLSDDAAIPGYVGSVFMSGGHTSAQWLCYPTFDSSCARCDMALSHVYIITVQHNLCTRIGPYIYTSSNLALPLRTPIKTTACIHTKPENFRILHYVAVYWVSTWHSWTACPHPTSGRADWTLWAGNTTIKSTLLQFYCPWYSP